MASLNVIPHPTSDNFFLPRANNRHPTTNNCSSIREPEGQYGDNNLAAIIDNLLKQPLWPAFEHGAYLHAQQAKRFYRIAHGIQALTHILNRAAYSRVPVQDYVVVPITAPIKSSQSLSDYQESQIWYALTELGAELVQLADELHAQSENEF